jgi:hypothetical protein
MHVSRQGIWRTQLLLGVPRRWIILVKLLPKLARRVLYLRCCAREKFPLRELRSADAGRFGTFGSAIMTDNYTMHAASLRHNAWWVEDSHVGVLGRCPPVYKRIVIKHGMFLTSNATILVDGSSLEARLFPEEFGHSNRNKRTC